MGSISLTLTLCLVLVLVSSWSFCSSDHLCLPDQRDALLHFSNSISVLDLDECASIDSWYYNPRRTKTWSKSIDCCSWDGVECDELTGHVIGVNLTQSCLSGSLPANNSLFRLQNLQWLDLSSNSLNGSLLENTTTTSSRLLLFHRLQRLNLAGNQFDGTISSELFTQLVSLTHLNLSHNVFSGVIPYEISLLLSLVSLDLSYNQFFGSIPRQFSLLSNLVSLDLSYNGLYGLRLDGQGFEMLATNVTKLTNLVLDHVDMSHVPLTSFKKMPSSLETLSLGDCELHGEFPPQLFQLPNLKHLDLAGNENLTGYLPDTNWGSVLEFLDLSYCDFRGSVPSSFGNLTQIISIHLSQNRFDGKIPDVFGNLTRLTSLSFSYCNLSGPLPITMFNLTRITSLAMSHNHLEGPLPNHVSELQLLQKLVLSHNSISGGLPSWLFTLPSLLRLDLGYNKLAGPISRIRMPSSVQYVDLSSNYFDGSIPDSVFDLVNLTQLHLSSNNLSGVVKSDMLSKLKSLQLLDLSNNRLLSLTKSDNDVNYSFPRLETVLFTSCSTRQFPNFFRTSMLKVLDLSNNMISGAISKWEAQGWEKLRVLNLSYNSLTTLEQFPGKNLEILDLRSNLLEGSILSTLDQPSLKVFLIAGNKLAGKIPPSICNSSGLYLLDLCNNNLSGTIPGCLGNFSYRLQFIGLQKNNLYGKIPDSFGKWLGYLFLNDNQFEGLVPPSLANCTNLEIVDLGNNKLTDRFPHWLASLPYLRVLILKSNRFHGSLPHSIASSNFSALRILDLSGNEFTGTLPATLFRNLRAMIDKPPESFSYLTIDEPRTVKGTSDMEYYRLSVNVTTKRLELQLTKTVNMFVSMDLSNNQFWGRIPGEVGQLVSLNMLNFSHNNFTGPIPASFGNLVALESLDLSSNKLGGRIPSQLTNLTFLEVLNLSENDLVGPIPHGKQFDTFDNDSYSGNLGLCGLPLSKQCSDRGGAEPPAPPVVEHEGSALPIFWEAAMMGYGSGIVLGVSLGYIVFTTRRPWWLVRMVEIHLQYNFTNWMRRRWNIPKRN